jgi:DinB superfamily
VSRQQTRSYVRIGSRSRRSRDYPKINAEKPRSNVKKTMNHKTIDEIYEANASAREKLKAVVTGLTPEQANFRRADNTWTVAELVEHIAIVEGGVTRIAQKLLSQSGTKKVGEGVQISPEFLEKAKASASEKIQAPGRVHPSGTVSISESIVKLDQQSKDLSDLRPMLHSRDGADRKFPHPAFGDLNVYEWLALIAGHELRHLRQIREVLEAQNS